MPVREGVRVKSAEISPVRPSLQACIDRSSCWSALANAAHDVSKLLEGQQDPTLSDEVLTFFVNAAIGEDN